jgi:hypothetical protein
MVLYLEKIVICICIILIAGINGKESNTTVKNFWDYYVTVVDKFGEDFNKIDPNSFTDFINQITMVCFRKEIYRRLKVKPWITLEELEDKFANVTNDTYIEDAYNELKESLIERGPIPMSYVIIEYICNIIVLICIFLVVYFGVYVIYVLFEFVYIFLMSEVSGFIIIGNLLPHLFENLINQCICSALMGLVVFYFVRRYTNWREKRKKEKEEKAKKEKEKETSNKEQKEEKNNINNNKSNEQSNEEHTNK